MLKHVAPQISAAVHTHTTTLSPAARRSCSGASGVATITVLFLTTCLASLSMVIANSSVTQLNLSSRGQNKAMGLSLADAGVDDAIDHLRSSHDYTGVSGQVVYEDPTTQKTPFGAFTTAITPATNDAYHATITSTGTNPNGTAGKVVAAVHYMPTQLGVGAARAGLNINVNGTANVSTLIPGQHDADMVANGNVSVDASASVIDGSITAAGTITAPVIPVGLSVNASLSLNPHSATTTFPSGKEILAIQAQLKADASPSSVNVVSANSLFINLLGLKIASPIVASPTYIVGDLHLKSGQTMTLSGTGTVYVEGNVILDNGATLINDAATLAVQGTFTQASGSVYATGVTSNLLSTLSLSTTPTLVAFNNGFTQGTAITLYGTAASALLQQGIVYAANGDVQINGTNPITGSLMAAGSINASASLTLIYPDTARSKITYPGDPVVTFWGEA